MVQYVKRSFLTSGGVADAGIKQEKGYYYFIYIKKREKRIKIWSIFFFIFLIFENVEIATSELILLYFII
jgi:hypothetical protein